MAVAAFAACAIAVAVVRSRQPSITGGGSPQRASSRAVRPFPPPKPEPPPTGIAGFTARRPRSASARSGTRRSCSRRCSRTHRRTLRTRCATSPRGSGPVGGEPSVAAAFRGGSLLGGSGSRRAVPPAARRFHVREPSRSVLIRPATGYPGVRSQVGAAVKRTSLSLSKRSVERRAVSVLGGVALRRGRWENSAVRLSSTPRRQCGTA